VGISDGGCPLEGAFGKLKVHRCSTSTPLELDMDFLPVHPLVIDVNDIRILRVNGSSIIESFHKTKL
jgi:hypothetical protein